MLEKTPKLCLDLDHPVDIAQRFRAALRPNLIRQNGIWYDYAGTHYQEIEPGTIKSALQTWMVAGFMGKLKNGEMATSTKPLAVQPYDVRHVIEALESLPEVHKEADSYKSPCWLNGDDSDPCKLLPCRNGLLDIKTRELRPHTPEFFCTYCLQLEYKPDVMVPTQWLEFLDQTFTGRKHLIDALQEQFGYIVSGDRSLEKIFFHRGRVRSGKGVIQTVLSHLVGDDNTASFSFGGPESTFGDKHGLAGAENARLILIPDITVGPRASALATTRLKEISGGDKVPVRPLFAPPTSMRLPGVIHCGANGIPNFGNDADAIASRILFWPHDNHVPVEKRDRTLKDPRTSPFLSVEALTGILNWALEGLDRLNKRGDFEEWPESLDMKRIMLLESNQIAAFIDRNCVLDPNGSVDKETLHRIHRDVCAEEGSHYKIESHFASALKRTALTLGAVIASHRPRVGKGRRYEWTGIKLTDENLAKYYEHDRELVEILGGETADTLILDDDCRPTPRPWSPPEGERDYARAFTDEQED